MKRIAAVAATIALIGAGVALAAAPASAAGPYSFVSVANSSYGMDEGSPWTAGTTFTAISPGGTSGYVELVGSDGLCLTENSATSLTSKACTGSSAQEFQSSHSPDFVWWNQAYDAAHHTQCPWGGAYTQAVIKGTPGAALTLACPDNVGNGIQWPYGADEEWTESPPVTTSPSPSPSPSSSSPSPSPSPSSSSPPTTPLPCPVTTGAAVTAPDIPNASHVGTLITSLDGTQIAALDATQTFYDDGANTNHIPPYVDANGNAVLSSDGGSEDQALVATCTVATGTGQSYLHGTFETSVWLSATSSNATAGFPGVWMGGLNCAPGVTSVGNTTTMGCWPMGGEWDLLEGLGGYAQGHYHWNLGGPGGGALETVGTYNGAPKVANVTGWHTITGQWGPGYVTVWLDGAPFWSYTSGNVESDAPLQFMLDMSPGTCMAGVTQTEGMPCATMLVQYLRVWTYQ